MKKILSIFISVSMLLAALPCISYATAAGTTFTSGDFTYKVNTDTSTVTLTAIASAKVSGAVTVPQTVSDGADTYTVTHLGDAFKNVEAKTKEMTSLVLPDTITNFTGTATFYACKGLKTIHLPLNLVSDGSAKDYPNCLYNTFQWCTALTSVELPSKITKCFGTFRNSTVRNVTITGKSAVDFYCTSGTETARAWNNNTTGITIYYPYNGTAPTRASGNGISSTVKTYGNTEFTSGNFKYKINDGSNTVTLISIAAEKLSGDITVPQTVSDGGKTYTVTALGDAFKGTDSAVSVKTAEMTSLVLPDTITSFTGTATFYACKGLKSIHLPANLVSDGSSKDYPNCLYNTFQWCTALTSVELPAKITKCFGTFKESAVKEVTITGKSAVDFYGTSTTVAARAWKDGVTGITIYYPADGAAPTRTNGSFTANVVKIGQEPEITGFEVGDFKYSIVKDTATVSATGFSAASDKSGAKVLPETVTYADKTYTVVSVGYAAFANQTNLTSFVMADTVTAVGQNIFYGCKNLQFVHLSESLTNAAASYQLVGTFYGCTALKTVIIPAGIRTLPKTFLNSGIENIVLQSTYTEIPKGASNEYVPVSNPDTVKVFYPSNGSVGGGYATYIKNYFVYDGVIAYKLKEDNTLTVVSSLPGYTMEGEVEIPEAVGALKVTEIAPNAFCNEDNITALTVPDSVTVIGSGAFSECDKLTGVKLSENIDGVLDSTFKNCAMLETVIIPEGVTGLKGTFEGCGKLKDIKLAQSVTALSDKAFYGCDSLKEIAIDKTVQNISDGANESGTVFSKATLIIVQDGSAALDYARNNNLNYAVKEMIEYSVNNGNAEITKTNFRIVGEYEVPASVVIDGASYNVTSIAAEAFKNQDALTILSLPDSVVRIADNAFDGCTNDAFASRVNSGTDAYTAVKAIGVCFIADDSQSGLAFKKYPFATGVEVYGASKGGQLSGDISISAFDGRDIVSIGAEAFKGQENVTAISMPDTVTGIGKSAFAGCTVLTTVQMSANAEGILDSTFEGCTALEDVSIPSGITALKNTYNGCTSLVRAIIPENVTAIYESTFANCTSLETVVIPETVTTFDRIIGFKDESQTEAEYVETNTSKKWVDNPFRGATDENLAICGTRGSAAEEFAYSSGIKFVDLEKGDYPFEYTPVSDKKVKVTIRDVFGKGDVSVIAALYGNGNKLLSVKSAGAEFGGESVFTNELTFDEYTENSVLKLMVWEDTETIKPLGKAVNAKEADKIKILVLGNSISNHGTSAASGWFAPDAQGMAATSIDKDFVHIVLNKAKEINPNVEVKIVSVWSLEAGFDKWQSLVASEYSDAVNYDADIIIAQFGENVKNNENEGSLGGSFDNENEFNSTVFANIVKAFIKDGKEVPVVAVTSMMNNKQVVLDAKQQACEENGWGYVNLCNDKNFAESKNSAYYLTPNQVSEGLELGVFKADVPIASGVYVHPGNNGMRAMAYGIWRHIEPVIEEMTFNN